MRKFFFIFTLIASAVTAGAQSAEELLDRVDRNEVYDTIQYTGKMTNLNEKRKRTEVKEFTLWARGSADSFLEFTNREDKGIMYLKKGNDYRYYSPDNERWIVLPEHMKKNLMGSALSYEDTIENEKLSSRYNAVIAGSEERQGREVWVLDLRAKDRKKESYPRRKLWIDKASGDLLHYELYALNGETVLKDYTLLRTAKIKGRSFPVEMEIRDRQNGIKTTFVMDESTIRLDEPLADSVFTPRMPRR
ncbi:MAG: outer membrane lipoprotein-sorting protein [Treponematales bacterium]